MVEPGQRARAKFVALTLSVLLASCGGGGGGTLTPPPAPPVVRATSITLNVQGNSALITLLEEGI